MDGSNLSTAGAKKHKKMSAEELDQEIEKLYGTVKDQNKGEIREKAAKLLVELYLCDQ